jgi:hypothetical protein
MANEPVRTVRTVERVQPVEPSSRWNGRAMAVACTALLLAILALVLAYLAHLTTRNSVGLATVPLGDQFITWLGLVLLLAGLFPLSAIAFRWLEVPGILDQVKRDFDNLRTDDTTEERAVRTDRTARRWSQNSYAVHYSLAIVATLLGIGLIFREPDKLLDSNALQAMRFGFLGAYIYCLNLIYRRYTTLDLQPHVYMYCAAGLLAGMVFNYVAFEAIANVAKSAGTDTENEFTGIGAAVAAILAFSLGYFPTLAIGWFGRLSRTALHEGQRRSDALPLALIDGISELHETRLRDEGIDNIQNLATANIHDLVEKTPFSAQEIVEWIDQAVLYLYLDPSEIASFRRAGARSVTDFADLWRGYCVKYEVKEEAFKRLPSLLAEVEGKFETRRDAVAQQLLSTKERLDSLYCATEHGPNMHFVKTYWDRCKKKYMQARAEDAGQCSRTPAPAPAVNAGTIVPDRGPAAGGTDVQIVGTGFSSVKSVSFGGVDAVDPEIDPVTSSILAKSPLHRVGDVDVIVMDDADKKLTYKYRYE